MRLPFFPLALSLLVAACSDGGGGDVAAPTQGSVLGHGQKLSALNDPATPRPAPDAVFTFTGLRVVTVDSFDETGGGQTGNIFMQQFENTPGPYQGILAFQSSYTPPSFRTTNGDVVDVTGPYQEFQLSAAKQSVPGWSTPELTGGNIQLRFDAPYIPLVPVDVELKDLADYATGRQWLSMLVTVHNVKLTKDMTKDGSGRVATPMFTPDLAGGTTSLFPAVSNELFDLQAYADAIKQQRGLTTLEDAEFESITGLVSVVFQFHINPRNADDLKLK